MRRFTSGLRRWFPVPTLFVGCVLVACVAIHIAVLIAGWISPNLAGKILVNGALTPSLVLRQPWTILTMAFLHSPTSLFHILFNMVALASIGPWLERALGTVRFGLVYIISALAGSLLFVLHALVFGNPNVPALGASGAIMGIVVGFGFVFPEAELRLFGVAPFKAKNIVFIALGMDAIAVIAQANIAVTVHLGGMLGAWLFLRRPWNRRYWMWAKARTVAKVKWLKMKYRLWKLNRP